MKKKNTVREQKAASGMPAGQEDEENAKAKGMTAERADADGKKSKGTQKKDGMPQAAGQEEQKDGMPGTAGEEEQKGGKPQAAGQEDEGSAGAGSGEAAAEGTSPKKKTGGKLRTALGIAIMLAGICVCLYPFYRQKKSNDFNEDAINMILTPQPTAGGVTEKQDPAPTKAPEVTEEIPTRPTPTESIGEPDGTGDAEGENTALLGEDLLENPDAPDQEAEDEKENANRLNGQTVIGVIQIPKIELIYAIVEGADSAEIGVAIGHMSNTAKLGETGNCALAGHRGGYSGPYFKNLDRLAAGDEVIITDTDQQVFTYKVTETMVVQPEEVWVIEDTGEDVAMLTLVTCENDGKERLIVRCVLP